MKSRTLLENSNLALGSSVLISFLLLLLYLFTDNPPPSLYYVVVIVFALASIFVIMLVPPKLDKVKIPPLAKMGAVLFIILLCRLLFMRLLEGENSSQLLLADSLKYMLNSTIFFAFIMYITPKITESISDLKLPYAATSFIQYFLSFIALILSIKVAFIIIEKVGIFKNLEELTSSQLIDFLGIGAIVISLCGTFYLIMQIFRKIPVEVPKTTKVLNFLLSFVFVIPILYWLSIPLPILGFFLGSLLFFVLLDLYVEKDSFDVGWVLTWVFFMGIYITSWILLSHPNKDLFELDDAVNIYFLTALISTIWIAFIFGIYYWFDIKIGDGEVRRRLSFQNKIQLLNITLILLVVFGVFIASFRYSNEISVELYFNYIRIFVIMLFVSLWISILAVKLLTRPLEELKGNLAALQFDKANKMIKPRAGHDELSELIQAYNQGVSNIEEGRLNIARAERETAWKEMAKQVAHEIKNPLTPMKLSLQHLQNIISKSHEKETKEMVAKLSNTFIAQIENLNKIADSFSNFSSIPKPQLEEVILNELLTNVHNLFNNLDNIEFSLYIPIDDIEVIADKHQLMQVLNNLVKNSIQAITDEGKNELGLINLILDSKDGYAIIEVEDNGPGIAEEIKDQVFSPKFTTKNSGTGLGLAISHKIIESHEGEIYFEENTKGGVSFIIKMKQH